MTTTNILIAVVAIALGIAASVLTKSPRSDRRRGEMGALAGRLGLHFDRARDERLPEQFGFLNVLAAGDQRSASNIMRGNYNGAQVLLFDYECYYGSKESERLQTTVLMLFFPLPFPELTVFRKTPVVKLATLAGYADIEFESAEFSRRFCVRSRDKKFAYDFCHPGMMEYLLKNRDLHLEIEGRVLALGCGRLLNPTEFVFNLTRLFQIRSLMPKYLFPRSGSCQE